MRMRRRARSRAEWEALVAEWRGSGVSQKSFAKRKGISPATLCWWSSRLGLEKQGKRRKPQALLPVRVIEDAPQEFLLRLAGGRTLVVPASFDASALRRLVAALEAEAC